MKGYSIHIGINKLSTHYSDYTQLTAADKDATAMQSIAKEAGYDVGSILTNQQATVQALKEQLNTIASKAKSGDTLMLTFSGHGANKDNVQSICMHDRLLGEKELLLEIDSLFKNKGTTIILVLDSCYSGGILDEKSRDINDKYVSKFLSNKAVESLDLNNEIYTSEWIETGEKSYSDFSVPIILIAACEKHRKAWERKDEQGVFTKYLMEAWGNGNYDKTYDGFVKEIILSISQILGHPARLQAPQLISTDTGLINFSPFKTSNKEQSLTKSKMSNNMDNVIQLNTEELNRFLASEYFLYEPYCTTIDSLDPNGEDSHNFVMRIIVPKGKKILCHLHYEGNLINRSTELHLYYYTDDAPPVDNLNRIIFPHPINMTMNESEYDLFVVPLIARDFGLRGHERLWPKIKSYGEYNSRAHDGTVHFPGGD